MIDYKVSSQVSLMPHLQSVTLSNEHICVFIGKC